MQALIDARMAEIGRDLDPVLVKAVRAACAKAAQAAYEQARMDGLCHEGALECAAGALQQVDVGAVKHGG